MSEWIPVLAGAVLATWHAHRALSLRTRLTLGIAIAIASTTLSGEVLHEPVMLVADLAFVVIGWHAARLARHAWHAVLRHRTQRPTPIERTPSG